MATAKEVNPMGYRYAENYNKVSQKQKNILANNGYTAEFIASFEVGYTAQSAYDFINQHDLVMDIRWNNQAYI